VSENFAYISDQIGRRCRVVVGKNTYYGVLKDIDARYRKLILESEDEYGEGILIISMGKISTIQIYRDRGDKK